MWLVLLWLIGIPKFLFHFTLTFVLLVLFVCYKIFGLDQGRARAQALQLQERFERQQRLLVASGGQLRETIKFVIMRGSRAMRLNQRTSVAESTRGFGRDSSGGNGRQGRAANNNHHNLSNQNNNNQNRAEVSRFHLVSLAVLFSVLLVGFHWPSRAYCLEQDAEILKPVANLAKAVIKTVTLGVPLEFNFDTTGLVKNFAYFTWRTGFPVTMPSGFVQKSQDFYNRVKVRVDDTSVATVERKSLASLRTDLDNIVDGIVDEVRQSPDGLYTNYLNTTVQGMPLEDACVAVGIQLKAYGVDLTNYRDIAGMVLGIPVMPTVASAMMNVKNLASLEAMQNLTSGFRPMSLARLPGSALGALNNARQQSPMQSMVQAPFSLLASGSRLLMPQQRPAAAAA